MVNDRICNECGSRNLNRDETRGEVVCEDCGLVLEDNIPETQSQIPVDDGKGGVLGSAPSYRRHTGLEVSRKKEEGDREWTLPPARKRDRKSKKGVLEKLTERQKEIDIINSNIEEIESNIDAEKIVLLKSWADEIDASDEILLEAYNKLIEQIETGGQRGIVAPSILEKMSKLKTKLSNEDSIKRLKENVEKLDKQKERIENRIRTVKKNNLNNRSLSGKGHVTFEHEDGSEQRVWMTRARARALLGLEKNDREIDIQNRIKDLKPEVLWFDKDGNKEGMVFDFIDKPGIPERAPIDENGERVETPGNERRGIELYAQLTGEEFGFWFFHDYLRRLKLNDQLIDKILKNGLPISSQLTTALRNSNDRSRIHSNLTAKDFLKRCERILGTGELPSIPHWFETPSEETWYRLALSSNHSENLVLHYWVSLNESNGLVRKYSDPLILCHIPIAYYVAQECRNREVKDWRNICSDILVKIEEDLNWCAATVEEMDNWWDELWGKHSDSALSVTRLRVTCDE